MVNGTDLGTQECLYPLFLRYGIDPPDPPTDCDVCNANFSYFMPWIVRREASSQLVITSSVMVLLTLKSHASVQRPPDPSRL